MKKLTYLSIFLFTLGVAACSANAQANAQAPFTFQGQLSVTNGPATGSFDMAFSLYDANVAGNLIAGPITNSAVAVNNGLFTVMLNFGDNVFTGTNYWVQIAVSPAGAGTFSTLVPRQRVTPTPYAISLVSPQVNALCPPGSVMAYMGTSAPRGWLLCDGSSVSQIAFPALFAVIGTACGSADSSSFNLPDMRGLFLRGVNGSRQDAYADPGDARTNIATGGNFGNAVGSYQIDIFANHSHVEGSALPNVSPADLYADQNIGTPDVAPNPSSTSFSLSTIHPWTSSTGGTETRSKNIYVNYIIKY